MCDLSDIKLSLKSTESVTFPSTGFSKPQMGLVITRGNVMVGRVKQGEGKARLPLLLSVGPYCLGLCPAGRLRVQLSLNLSTTCFIPQPPILQFSPLEELVGLPPPRSAAWVDLGAPSQNTLPYPTLVT